MKGQQVRTSESFSLLKGKKGDVFYTEMSDKSITARASYFSRKVKTSRIMALSDGPKPKVKRIVEVTILK